MIDISRDVEKGFLSAVGICVDNNGITEGENQFYGMGPYRSSGRLGEYTIEGFEYSSGNSHLLIEERESAVKSLPLKSIKKTAKISVIRDYEPLYVLKSDSREYTVYVTEPGDIHLTSLNSSSVTVFIVNEQNFAIRLKNREERKTIASYDLVGGINLINHEKEDLVPEEYAEALGEKIDSIDDENAKRTLKNCIPILCGEAPIQLLTNVITELDKELNMDGAENDQYYEENKRRLEIFKKRLSEFKAYIERRNSGEDSKKNSL